MAQTNPEQSKRFGPVAPQRYGEPSRWSIADINCDSNLRKPVLDGVEGERSIVGFGLASQVGFESETAAATIATSSGEQETSFTSPPGPVTRGRVWANADVDNATRAKLANKARGNSFLNAIDRELPSLK